MRRVLLCSIVVATTVVGCGKDEPSSPTDLGHDGVGHMDLGGDAAADMEHALDGGRDAGADAAHDLGPDSGVDTPFDVAGRSGSRLRLRALEAEGGGRVVLGFWDSLFETACSFQQAGDGVLRCLPDSTLAAFWADDHCQSNALVVVYPSCGDDDVWARVENHVVRRTNEPHVGTEVYYSSPDGCGIAGSFEDVPLWKAEIVPTVEFVAGAIVAEPRADGLVALLFEGEDGSRLVYATRREQPSYLCVWDDEDRCMPARAPSAELVYRNPACTDPLISTSTRASVPSALSFDVVDERSCVTNTRYFETGSRVELDVIYENDNGTCVPRAADRKLYTLGDELLAEDAPTATVVLEGSGAITARRLVDAAGAPLESSREFTEGEARCSPAELATGEWICLQHMPLTGSLEYSDDTCTSDSRLFRRTCQADAAFGAAFGQVCQRGVVEQVFEIGALFTGDVYRLSGGSCTAVTYPTSWDPFESGADITPSLPRLTPRIDAP